MSTVDRAWYITNRERIAAQQRVYRAAHLPETAAQKRAWSAAHREQIRSYGATYRAAHREEIAVRTKAYRAAHRAEITARERPVRAARQRNLGLVVYAWVNPDGYVDYVGRGTVNRPIHARNLSWWTPQHMLVVMTCDNEWQAMEYEGKWGGRYRPAQNIEGARR